MTRLKTFCNANLRLQLVDLQVYTFGQGCARRVRFDEQARGITGRDIDEEEF